MVQDALLAAYRWLLGSAGLALRLLPLLLMAGLVGFGLYVLLRRVDPDRADRLSDRLVAARPRLVGPLIALVVALLMGGPLVQARKMVVARRQTLDRATASRRDEPSLSGVVQFAPAVAVLEEKTYRRTLTLPPDFLTRIGAEGVQVLAPYLSDPSAEEVLRLKDEFKRSGEDVVFTREVVRRDETTIAADAAEVGLNFGGKGARDGKRHFEAVFDGTYRFRNPRSAEAAMRFNFPLPQGGGTLQEFVIEAAGQRITDPDEKGLYAWSGTVPSGGEVRAHVRYRVTGAGAYEYALGSERRRIGDFRLVAVGDQVPRFGRSGIFPTRLDGNRAEWRLRDVLTAQSIALVFPRADVHAEGFEKTLWWLPAVLGLFSLGAVLRAPGSAARATLAFGLGLLGIPVLSAYLGSTVATVLGAVLAAILGSFALPQGKGLAWAMGLLSCVFLTLEHGAILAWVLGLGLVGAWAVRTGGNLEPDTRTRSAE